MKIQQ